MHPWLSDEDQDRVVDSLANALQKISTSAAA
jgi:hypothetical protein